MGFWLEEREFEKTKSTYKDCFGREREEERRVVRRGKIQRQR